MTIHEKIEKIFAQESDNRPEWATELLTELKEIKSMLQVASEAKKVHDYTFYDFVNSFRKSMMPNVQNNVYPEIQYNEQRLGVNFKGLLYDKESSYLLSRAEAINVYRYLYKHNKDAV